MDLFENFPAFSEKKWKQQIQFELNGLDCNNTLLWEFNSITIKLFYTKNELKFKTTNSLTPFQTNKQTHQTLDIISDFAKNITFTSKVIDPWAGIL